MDQNLVVGLLLLAVLVIAALVFWQMRARREPLASVGETDRFSVAPAISEVQLEMLQYLQKAFPARPVLFRVPLSTLVTVRQSANRLAAQRWLQQTYVDYVVCHREGRPAFAFELDAAHTDADEATQDATAKDRVLKTAGIRLVQLKRSAQHMPPTDEFRQRLRSASLDPAAPSSRPVPLEHPALADPGPITQPLDDDAPTSRTGRGSRPMSVTDLMDLPAIRDDSPADPWGDKARHG